MKKDLIEKIEIPKNTEARVEGRSIIVKGKNGEIKREITSKKITAKVEGNHVVFTSLKATQREKRIMYSIISHLKNMFYGVNNMYVYKLKVCSTHFPMTVAMEKGVFTVKNFLGEAKARTYKIVTGVKVMIEASEITVESHDRELAGQAAGSIESVCRITDKDRRVFQDGIYITAKPKRIQNE